MMKDLESNYYEYLLQHGHISQDARSEAFGFYLPFFSPGQSVLDIGCGDGTFMEMLQEKGCAVVGVDIDPEMVEICHSKGLEVEEADALEYLTNSAEERYDFVFASNFVEHLPSSAVVELLSQAYRVLKPEGKILLATPNPESLVVHLHEFWRDATHVRPYNRQLLEFLLWYCNYELVKSGVNEETNWQFNFDTAASADEVQQILSEHMKEIEWSLAEQAAPARDASSGLRAEGESRSAQAILSELGIAGSHEATKEDEIWSVHETLSQPAYIVPLSAWGRVRIKLAQIVYRVIREVDLRLYRLETAVKHLAMDTDTRVSKLETATTQVAENMDERLSKLESVAKGLAESTDKKFSALRTVVAQSSQHANQRSSDLEKALLFLSPPREIYVLGQKPSTGNNGNE